MTLRVFTVKVLGSNPGAEVLRTIIGVRLSGQKVDKAGSSIKLKIISSQRCHHDRHEKGQKWHQFRYIIPV